MGAQRGSSSEAHLWAETASELILDTRVRFFAGVGVPETFGGYRSSGVLRLTIFSSVQQVFAL